jgi:hypothetical protein
MAAEDTPARLIAVKASDVLEAWGHAHPFVLSIAARSEGRFSEATLMADLIAGDKQLWLIGVDGDCRGVVVTQIAVYATGMKVCSLIGCSGHERGDWLHLVEELKRWARSMGCARIESWARPGWAKVLNWRETHRLIEVEL